MNRQRLIIGVTAVLTLGLASSLPGQNNIGFYTPSSVTGQLQLTRTVVFSQVAGQGALRSDSAASSGPETTKFKQVLPPPRRLLPPSGTVRPAPAFPAAAPLGAVFSSSSNGFDGLTHYDQRMANSGNQFSLEPPNPSIAVANGMILEGVNDAVRVFSTAGLPLSNPVASNQLFGVGPAIDRTQTPNVYGVYTTDMRVFYDPDTSRWFVIQRSQDEDAQGNPENDSHLYIAVSQTSNPTGTYNIYVMDTANGSNPGCPCVDDYPQIGADRYGIYISANEYSLQDPTSPYFNDVMILAISKTDLAVGRPSPSSVRFIVPYIYGYEFAIQPATTSPDSSSFIASGGVEFLTSSIPNGYDNALSLWGITNTASLNSANPNLTLYQSLISTLPHVPPPYAAPQLSGAITSGTSLEGLDAGYFSDSRVLSTAYAGGRLYVTMASAVFDASGSNAAGGLYIVLSPTWRGGILSATSPVKQGYLFATGNHILRPAISVNAQGKGAIAFTLVGNSYFPSAAWVGIDLTAGTPTGIQIARTGFLPEDGFSGWGSNAVCPTCSGFGIARWGDYSTAVTAPDGSTWFVSEYIPNSPRTPLANWGTYIQQWVP